MKYYINVKYEWEHNYGYTQMSENLLSAKLKLPY